MRNTERFRHSEQDRKRQRQKRLAAFRAHEAELQFQQHQLEKGSRCDHQYDREDVINAQHYPDNNRDSDGDPTAASSAIVLVTIHDVITVAHRNPAAGAAQTDAQQQSYEEGVWQTDVDVE